MVISLERRIFLTFCVIGLVWAVTKRERAWQSSWFEPGVQYQLESLGPQH